MMNKSEALFKKIKELKDLRSAIREVKKSQLEKMAKSAPELKHLGMIKPSEGVISHIIGPGLEGVHKYRCDVNLTDDQPKIKVFIINDDDTLTPNNKIFDSIKDAMKEIVHHFSLGDWSEGNGGVIKSEPIDNYIESLQKALEDKLIPQSQRREFRQKRNEFSGRDMLADQQQITAAPGVSDIGVHVRRGDPKETGAIAHGFARVGLSPNVHMKVAKKLRNRLFNEMKNQPKPNLPKSELEKIDFTPKVNSKDPVLNHDKVGPQKVSDEVNRKAKEKITKFLTKKGILKSKNIIKSESLSKNQYLKNIMQQMRQQKEAAKAKQLEEFHNKKAKEQNIPKQDKPIVSPNASPKKLFDPDLSGTFKKSNVRFSSRISSKPYEINRIQMSPPITVSGPTVVEDERSDKLPVKGFANVIDRIKKRSLKRE